jgi:hypothetical protein
MAARLKEVLGSGKVIKGRLGWWEDNPPSKIRTWGLVKEVRVQQTRGAHQ